MSLLDAIARPRPGTEADVVYSRLLAQMSRAGLPVDRDGCAELSYAIQQQGHRSCEAVRQAQALGLDPRFLPRRRDG